MLPPGHIMASGVISLFVWAYFRSFGCAVVSFAAGVLIDIDHLLDYYANLGFTLNAKKVYGACCEMRLDKLYLAFHSYELVMLLWIAIYAFSLSNIWRAAAIGMTQHLIFDQFTNPIKLPSYFLAYRIANRFRRESVIRS